MIVRGSATMRSKVGKQHGLTILDLEQVCIRWVEWEDEESPWVGGTNTRLGADWGIGGLEVEVSGGVGLSRRVSTGSWEV